MPSNATDPPPVSAGIRPELEAAAAADAQYLSGALSGGPRFTSGDYAAELLNRSAEGLAALILAGHLDAVVLSGQVHVPTAQLQRLVRDLLTQEAERSLTLRTQASLALRGYLGSVEVTGDWDAAREQGRPLVTARRGAHHQSFGINYHSVVLRPSWVSLWALGNRELHPELASLPTGPVLRTALTELVGVSEVGHAVPLETPGAKSHRIIGWIRVDPQQWPVRVPSTVAAIVDGVQS